MRFSIPLSGRTFFLFLGALFLCVGSIAAYSGIQDATRERAFQKRGQTVQAVVVSKSIQRASRDGNSSTRYEIVYRFSTDDGPVVEGVDAVTVEEWESLEPRSPFTVTYVPGAPESSRAAGSGGMASPLLMVGLGVLFALVGGGVLGWTGGRLWREWRLLRQGQPAQGTVLAIEPSDVAVNRVRQWNIRYRYKDHLGRSQEGTSGPLPPAEAHAVAVGDAVTVRFDRQDPQASVWDRAPASTAGSETARPAVAVRLRSFLKRLANWGVMLGIVFVAIVIAEAVPVVKDLERFTIRHQAPLLAMTIGMTALGFILFMGSILYRIFGGAGEPMSHADVEDLSRSVRMDARPAFARVSRYRFRGRSAGSSFSGAFTVRQAKEAWRRRAWRTSPEWRANFAVMAGAFMFMTGLFGIFVVIGPNYVKVLCGAALVYAAVMIVTAFIRA